MCDADHINTLVTLAECCISGVLQEFFKLLTRDICDHDNMLDRMSAALQEFFQLLMRDMFDADYGMFKLDEETGMYWFRASNIDMSMEFELVGTMIGLAIYNSHLLEFSFPMLTYRSVLCCCQECLCWE